MPFTQTRWPLFGALVAGGLIVAVFWWLMLEDRPGEAVPATGGTYVEGVTQAPARINPLYARANPTDADLAALIFSGLVRLGADGTPQPDLAARWEITGNGQRYVFYLRSGVAWHDGEPFSAEDIEFTYRTISDPAFNGDPALAELMQGVIVEATDPLTVEFQLEQAYAPFLAHLTVGILPRHILGDVQTSALLNATFNLSPIGTGAYVFGRRTDTSLELRANSTYYLGPPHITEFEFRTYASEEALLDALRDDEVDGGLLPEGLPPAELSFFESDERWEVRSMPGAPYYMLYVNTRSALFDDRDIRVAILQAIDRAALVSGAAGGRGVVVNGGIPPDSWAFTDVEVPPFDPGEAATTLEVEGFFRGRDGVRSNIDNLRLEFEIAVLDTARHVGIAQDLAEQLRHVGIAATPVPTASAGFTEILNTRGYEAALVLVDPGPDPDQYPFWHGSQILPPGLNLANYSDPRIDETVERARQTTDAERRKDLYALFDGYFVAGMPSIPLYAPTSNYVQVSDVGGFEERLLYTAADRFADVHEWYVETRTR